MGSRARKKVKMGLLAFVCALLFPHLRYESVKMGCAMMSLSVLCEMRNIHILNGPNRLEFIYELFFYLNISIELFIILHW